MTLFGCRMGGELGQLEPHDEVQVRDQDQHVPELMVKRENLVIRAEVVTVLYVPANECDFRGTRGSDVLGMKTTPVN